MTEKAATYPAGVIAKLLLLTERRVQQLSMEGVIPKADRGRYPLAAAIQGYVKYLKDRTVGGDPDTIDIGEYKARFIKARARTAELEADALEAKLLDRAEVEQAWKTMVLNMRAKLLAIPTRAAPQLVGVSTTGAVAALLETLVTEALSELANQPIDSIPEPAAHPAAAESDTVAAGDGAEYDEDGSAAAEADDLTMG